MDPWDVGLEDFTVVIEPVHMELSAGEPLCALACLEAITAENIISRSCGETASRRVDPVGFISPEEA